LAKYDFKSSESEIASQHISAILSSIVVKVSFVCIVEIAEVEVYTSKLNLTRYIDLLVQLAKAD
jgi:hypothetical protein